MDVPSYKPVEKINFDGFPGHYHFVQLEPASHIGEIRYRQSGNVLLQTTRYCCESITVGTAGVDRVAIAVKLSNASKLGVIGRGREVHRIVTFAGDSPVVMRASGGGEFACFYVNCRMLEDCYPDLRDNMLTRNCIFEITDEFRKTIADEVLKLVNNPMLSLDSGTMRIVGRILAEIENKKDRFKPDTQIRYVESAIFALIKSADSNEITTVAEMAANAACSQRTLQYAFQRHLGVSPKQFLSLFRLTEFRRRLVFDPNNETNIAYKMGYTNLSRIKRTLREFFLPF